MTDYQQLVDEIRSFLQSVDMTMTDRLKELAVGYAEACRAVNQRLRRCDEFLKKGLRSEAIHFAQAEPALLDLVATLDFPERSGFQETLAFYAMGEPPRLLLEIAEALNQAYAEEQPLEELLRRHRRLALLRAPLAARLKVMRTIAGVDKNNLVWTDDIQAFEAARFREIQAEVAGPARGKAGRVAALAQELQESDWLAPPPAALVEQVRRVALEEVIGELNAAMATADVPGAQSLRTRYLVAVKASPLTAGDPLFRQAERPLAWLAESEQFQARELEYQNAVAALEQALDEQADIDEVTPLYHAALNLERGLPRRLDRRYRDYAVRADRTRRWRERVILLAVLFGGLLLLLAFLGYLWLKARAGSQSPAEGARRRPATHVAASMPPPARGKSQLSRAATERCQQWVTSTTTSA